MIALFSILCLVVACILAIHCLIMDNVITYPLCRNYLEIYNELLGEIKEFYIMICEKYKSTFPVDYDYLEEEEEEDDEMNNNPQYQQFLEYQKYQQFSHSSYTTMTSDVSKDEAIRRCLLGFIGIGGIHRFYVGKFSSGMLYFLTFGLFGFGTICDLFKLLLGEFRDNVGQPLRR